MSRWSETYKARALPHDAVDTVDTVPPGPRPPPYCVNTVNSVTPSPDVFAAIERAAIQAEAIPVRLLRKRPVSWARAEDEPADGDFCGCCAGSLWWSDTDPPRGWCCTTCHPPCDLQAGQFRVVAT